MTENNEEESLRETLEKAFEEHSVEPTQTETPVAEAAAVEKPVAETRKDGRDGSGKFTAKPEQAAEKPVVKKAPEFWPAARKEKFATLPPDVQDMMLEREGEVEKGFTKMDDERQFGKALKEVITPYMATIQAEGGTAPAAVKDLLNTAYVLRTGSAQQKAQLVQQVIKQYGVDMRLLGVQQPVQGQSSPSAPAISKDDIKREIMGELQTQQMNDRISSELKAFTADPKNVHFSNPAVKGKMSSLLGTGEAKDYQDAYDQAIWLVPELRSALIAAQSPPQQQQRTQDNAAKKKAGSSVSGSPGITVPNSGNPDRTLREELEANWNAAVH